jgi:hypothetical protein
MRHSAILYQSDPSFREGEFKEEIESSDNRMPMTADGSQMAYLRRSVDSAVGGRNGSQESTAYRRCGTPTPAAELTLAERRLRYPTLQVLGAAGQIPFHDHTLQGDYAAAGFNLNIPVSNGGLYRAREPEAAFEAGARSKDVGDLSLRLNQQVRDAISQLNEALRTLERGFMRFLGCLWNA